MTTAIKAYEQGRYANAEKLFQAAIKEAKQFEPDDSRGPDEVPFAVL